MDTEHVSLDAKDLIGEPRDVVLLVAENVSSLEMAGPAEVFLMAARKLTEAGRIRGRPYRVHLVSATDSLAIKTSVGLYQASSRFSDYHGQIDTLLVVGGLDIWNGAEQPGFFEWLKAAVSRSRRYGSICTGAFVLAQAGLLDGEHVTTHWYFCERLAREYPNINVDPEPIFICNGRLSTAAGVTSGIDLALALVEEDLGLDIALRIARALVLYVRRPGWQSQFSSALALQAPTRLSFRELPFWILENLSQPMTVEEMAARVSMSTRNFSRTFKSEFGLSPQRFVTQLRVEMAQRLLHESDRKKLDIALECGFGSVDSLERALSQVE